MLRPRIIPFLTISKGLLVKTTKFRHPKYIGDPLNVIRIFNEKQVDELIIADISATPNRLGPDYTLLSAIASECRMPLAYCGGITTPDEVEKVIQLGFEKIGISTALHSNPSLIEQSASRVGSQSIVSVIDVKKAALSGRHQVFTHSATKNTGLTPLQAASLAQECGAGEILLSSIDRDGTLAGYDHNLISSLADNLRLPLSVLGGCGSLQDIIDIFSRFGLIGCVASSLFIFKGKHKAVLPQYPAEDVKIKLLATYASRTIIV